MALLREIEKANHALRHEYAQHQQAAPILRVRSLTVAYEAGRALDNISFDLGRTLRMAIVGPNGAGKSTLIKVIAGLQSPTSGEVEVFGDEPDTHICIAYVSQRSQVDWRFPITVRDVVMMGRIGKLGLLRRPARRDWEIIDHALETVHLQDLRNRQINELSGGQQQRMFIARALAQEAELVLMDEPLTGLDTGSQADIFAILNTLQQQRVTVLVALHDLKLAAEHFDIALLLNHSLIGFGAPQQVFSPENLIAAYGSQRVSGSVDGLPLDDTCCGHNHDHA